MKGLALQALSSRPIIVSAVALIRARVFGGTGSGPARISGAGEVAEILRKSSVFERDLIPRPIARNRRAAFLFDTSVTRVIWPGLRQKKQRRIWRPHYA